jgi:hypothetical protein
VQQQRRLIEDGLIGVLGHRLCLFAGGMAGLFSQFKSSFCAQFFLACAFWQAETGACFQVSSQKLTSSRSRIVDSLCANSLPAAPAYLLPFANEQNGEEDSPVPYASSLYAPI